MNAYFFKMNKAERNDILDQHRKVYDGFVTDYGQQINQQPLYVQDYANDKGGLVVNNKGNVKTYTNMNINESDALTGAKYLPNVSFDFGGHSEEDEEYIGFGGEDKIGDSETDMAFGTFDSDNEDVNYEIDFETEPRFDLGSFEIDDEDVEYQDVEKLEEQLNRTLNMFRKLKNY